MALVLISMWSVTAALWLVWPRTTVLDPSFTDSTQPPSFLPWVIHRPVLNQQVSVAATMNPFTARVWRVVPDDELLGITANGQPLSLDAIPKSALSDWSKGFDFDFSPWLHNGANTLKFFLNNHGGDGGITLHPVLGWRWLVIYLGFLPWLYTLCRIFKLRRHQVIPLCLSLLLIMAYWSVTPWTVRTHDVAGNDGHLAYISRIAVSHTLPKATENWELFQAPLYYVGGAVIWQWANVFDLPIPVCLQAYSLALWMVFLCASAATLQLALRFRVIMVSTATTTLAIWPSGIIHSLRIGNDVGLYACAALATLYLLKWWHRNRQRDLLLMSIFIALGLLTKSNAIVLAAAASGLMLTRLLRRRHRQNSYMLQNCIHAWSIMGMGATLYMGRNLLYYWHGAIPDWLTGTSAGHMGDWLKVPSRLGNFITLEPLTFLKSPWLVLTDDATGRALFWNTLLRSSLTGEFHFNGELQLYAAYLWGALLLWLFVTVLGTLLWQATLLPPIRLWWRQLPSLILITLWVASLMSFRFHVPYSCNNDFRYILPVLIPFLIFVCSRKISAIPLSVMAACSMLFFLTLSYG